MADASPVLSTWIRKTKMAAKGVGVLECPTNVTHQSTSEESLVVVVNFTHLINSNI